MPGRLIAIGDIHGCSRALEILLNQIEPTAADCIVTLGDYVDRGPDSRGVIENLLTLSNRCQLIALRGNHEEMMQAVVGDQQPPGFWLRHGGVDTLDSYGFVGDLDVIPETHLRFLDELIDFYETETHVFTHAAYQHDLPMDQQPAERLRWHSLRDDVPLPHVSGKRFVVGHTASLEAEIVDLDYLVCIDTYCYGEGWLTGLDVHAGTVWQANQAGQSRTRPRI